MNAPQRRIAAPLCLAALALAALAPAARAVNLNDPNTWTAASLRETVSHAFLGINHALRPQGLELALSLTNIYQQNLRGGLSTNDDAGSLTGSYDLEAFTDLNTLLGLQGLSAYMLAEGAWPHEPGLNDDAVGALMNPNTDAPGHRTLDVTELWLQQAWNDGRVRLRLGKIDLTGGFDHRGNPVAFDNSLFANDETTQFLNDALVNNPTIPFPDNGLAAVLYASPYDHWYLAFAAADAHADLRETGFNTTFHGPDNFFYIAETGLTPILPGEPKPLPGAWRIGLWFDPQPKPRFNSDDPSRNDAGFYAAIDQLLIPENADPHDSQGLAAFARYGYAPSDAYEITSFVSAGCQYQGPIPNRDDDIIAFGFAHGLLSDHADLPAHAETVYELYYNAHLIEGVHLTPSLQYIADPAADPEASDALLLACRLQLTF